MRRKSSHSSATTLESSLESKEILDSRVKPWSDGQGAKTLTAMAFIHTTTSTTSFLRLP
jgi:ABC-type Na+ transport system ATPase subunit NatA